MGQADSNSIVSPHWSGILCLAAVASASIATARLLAQSDGKLRSRATAAEGAFGRQTAEASWAIERNAGSRIHYLSASGVVVGIAVEDGEVFTVRDDSYVSSRMRVGPGQGSRFAADVGWKQHAQALITAIWPGTALEFRRVRRTGRQQSCGAWASNNNLVSVSFQTRPYGGYYRLVTVSFDQETGRPTSVIRTKRMPAT